MMLPDGLQKTECLAAIREHMIKDMIAYEPRPNYYHFKKLKQFKGHWAKIFSRKICFGCLNLISYCQIFLPCGHGLCETCYRNVTSLGEITHDLLSKKGPLECQRCPLCQKSLPGFHVELSPPTASARVLALDGGGPLGIVTLKMLQSFSKELDLVVPFHMLFDGIWGTSVGNFVHPCAMSIPLISARRNTGDPFR